MRDAYSFAKYFIKNKVDSVPDTYDGNMKLQKMMVLADMAHIAQYGELLFPDDVLAFTNGPVVEKIRTRYKNDYKGLQVDSDKFDPDFTQKEYDTLSAVIGVYGHLSAKELSDLTHCFRSWKQAYQNGMSADGYHNKEKSVINFSEFAEDVELVGRAVRAYKETRRNSPRYEVINGVTFYYDDIIVDENVAAELEKFSLVCEENVYSVCNDKGKLVIY